MRKLLGVFIIIIGAYVAVYCAIDGQIPCRTGGGICVDVTTDPLRFWFFWAGIFGSVICCGLTAFFTELEQP